MEFKIFEKLAEFDLTYDGENKYATFDNEDCDEDSKIYLLTD
jgi:hypothetical protein